MLFSPLELKVTPFSAVESLWIKMQFPGPDPVYL